MSKIFSLRNVLIAMAILILVFLTVSSFKTDTTLKTKIENAIDQATGIEDVSVYFYDFTTKEAVGVNENKQYPPASLYKVPLMMSYFKLAESKPEVTQQQFMRVTEKDENAGQFYKPKEVMPLNVPKTSDETINYMIAYSDNIATNILYNYLGEDQVRKTFNDFGIELQTKIQDQSISPKDYTKFLIALHDKTYLDPVLSDVAIDFLKKSDFKKGLQDDVPEVIAHKFGTPPLIGKSYQLHDCGIVYVPDHPYALCVMSKGKSREQLESVVQSISHATYEWVTTPREK